MLQVPRQRHLGSSELIHRKALEWKDSGAFISRSDSPLAQNLAKVGYHYNVLRSNFPNFAQARNTVGNGENACIPLATMSRVCRVELP
jgi:hypothetical protein